MDHTAVRRAYLRELESVLQGLSRSGDSPKCDEAGTGLPAWRTALSPGLHSSISDGYSPGKPLPPGHVRMRHSFGALARRSKSIALSDPRVDHAGTCPNCMNRLLALRRSANRRDGSWPGHLQARRASFW